MDWKGSLWALQVMVLMNGMIARHVKWFSKEYVQGGTRHWGGQGMFGIQESNGVNIPFLSFSENE